MSTLRDHVETMHRRVPPHLSEQELAQWHATQHHRFVTSHFHEGRNSGPGDRPPGWRTGEDAVLRR